MDTLNQIIELLAKSITYAPFLAAVGGFAITGQIFKSIFSKKRALKKGKFQSFFWHMRKTLPLHPILAGVALGMFDKTNGIGYYALAGLLSVFLFDLIKRFTGYTVELPSDSLPPEG